MKKDNLSNITNKASQVFNENKKLDFCVARPKESCQYESFSYGDKCKHCGHVIAEHWTNR